MASSFSRHRTAGSGFKRPGGYKVITVQYGASRTDPNITTIATVQGGQTGEFGVCDDVVTVGLRDRIARGEIVNNPFVSIKSERDFGGSGPVIQHVGSFKPFQILTQTYEHANTNWVTDYNMTDHWAREDYVLGGILPPDAVSALTASKTSALSKVDTSHAAALTSLGELNATFKMLLNPLSSINNYVRRYKWRVSKNKRTVYLTIHEGAGLYPTLANEYLAFYYGLKPFLRDLETILDAFVKSGYQPERITARGGAKDSETSVTEWYTGTWPPQPGRTWARQRKTVTTSYDARAGILYEPSKLDWRKSYGFRIGDVLPALWDLTPWSFLLDYFGNFSKLIGAVSPRSGINYLAVWEGIRVTREARVEAIDWGIGGTDLILARQGTEWATSKDYLHYRSPTSPYSNIGLQFHTGNWDSKLKVLAVTSLIVQQLAQLPGFQILAKA